MNNTENQNTNPKFLSPRDTVLRNIRDVVVNLIVDLARVIFFWVPGGDPAYGRALMTFHPFAIMLTVAFFFLLRPKHPVRLLIACLALLVVASQWLLGGCVITRAEQRLTGNKETIMDPFLTLAGLPADRDDVMVFHAGTQPQGSEVLTSGGRVLCVTALGGNLRQAQQLAYAAVGLIHFHGMQWRRDIGHRALHR